MFETSVVKGAEESIETKDEGQTTTTVKVVESAVRDETRPETTQDVDSSISLKRKANDQQEFLFGSAPKKQKRQDRGTISYSARSTALLLIANNRAAAEEIQRYQDSTELLMSSVLFQKIIAELMEDMHSDLKVDSSALEALQEAAEGYIVSMFRGMLA